MPTEAYSDYFLSKIDDFKKVFKDEMSQLAMSALDIADGFDFEDEELLSVLGKKNVKDADAMYEELLQLVRKNPVNAKPVPAGFNRYMKPILMGKL